MLAENLNQNNSDRIKTAYNKRYTPFAMSHFLQAKRCAISKQVVYPERLGHMQFGFSKSLRILQIGK